MLLITPLKIFQACGFEAANFGTSSGKFKSSCVRFVCAKGADVSLFADKTNAPKFDITVKLSAR